MQQVQVASGTESAYMKSCRFPKRRPREDLDGQGHCHPERALLRTSDDETPDDRCRLFSAAFEAGVDGVIESQRRLWTGQDVDLFVSNGSLGCQGQGYGERSTDAVSNLTSFNFTQVRYS